MQREEKQLENSLEILSQTIQEVKNAITSFLMKLEHEYETLSWPTALDNFALISGQVSTLNRLLKSDKMMNLKNQVVFPIQLSHDRDQNIEQLTEGRVPAFNHEVAPSYLRTKPEPEVEEKVIAISTKANSMTPEAIQRQMNSLNKITNNLAETINSTRDEWESDSQKSQPAATSSLADTNTLIAATSFGKNLRTRPPQTMQPMGMQGHMGQPDQRQAPPGYAYAAQQGYYHGNPQPMHMNKMPSTIKTQIKTQVNPYSR